jgi:hypothetical protein
LRSLIQFRSQSDFSLSGLGGHGVIFA